MELAILNDRVRIVLFLFFARRMDYRTSSILLVQSICNDGDKRYKKKKKIPPFFFRVSPTVVVTMASGHGNNEYATSSSAYPTASIIRLQKWIRGFMCRSNLQKLKDQVTFFIVTDLLRKYTDHYRYICELNDKLIKKKIRHANFPPEISENLIKFIIFQRYHVMPTWDTDTGDLQCGMLVLEVKAFSSFGPTTFGPNEKWDRIYFLDATRFAESIFKVYECKLKNTSSAWRALKINSTETFEDQCRQGRRPRIRFHDIYRQLRSHCHLIFDDEFPLWQQLAVSKNHFSPSSDRSPSHTHI